MATSTAIKASGKRPNYPPQAEVDEFLDQLYDFHFFKNQPAWVVHHRRHLGALLVAGYAHVEEYLAYTKRVTAKDMTDEEAEVMLRVGVDNYDGVNEAFRRKLIRELKTRHAKKLRMVLEVHEVIAVHHQMTFDDPEDLVAEMVEQGEAAVKHLVVEYADWLWPGQFVTDYGALTGEQFYAIRSRYGQTETRALFDVERSTFFYQTPVNGQYGAIPLCHVTHIKRPCPK